MRRLRRSRGAPVARRAAARLQVGLRRLGAPDGVAQALRARATLALRGARTRRRAVGGYSDLLNAIAQLPPPGPTRSTVSLVVVIEGTQPEPALVAAKSATQIIAVLRARDARAPLRATTILPFVEGESPAAAAARGAEHASGDLLCFSTTSAEPAETAWMERLLDALETRKTFDHSTVAAAPQLVHPLRSRLHATPDDGRVRQLGLQLAVDDDAPILVARGAGELPTVSAPPTAIAGASATCLLIDRQAYRAAGGLTDYSDIDVATFELCRRVRARGGSVVVVPSAIVFDHRPVASSAHLTRPIPRDSPAWAALVDDAGPALLREVAPLGDARLRIAITIAAPSRKVAPRWGDWHLAQSFAKALRRRGHVVRVQTADAANDLAGRSCDVHCVVRGLARVRRTRGQRHVLWLISHPEDLDAAELDESDLVLVASRRFAAELRTRTRTPVETMLQATDPTRFRPLSPDPAHRHDVAVVAKSRDVYRSAVADAIASGLRPAIYGSGWERLVEPALIAGDYVANENLPRVYSSVGVLLNDHWESMREWGFVSNRLFDALACGTPVISDDVPETEELFQGAVPMYRDADELRALVDEALAHPDEARERARRGRAIVLARHTFDQRALEFEDTLARHDLIARAAPTRVREPES